MKILPESDGFGGGAVALVPARTAGLFDRGALRRGIERAADADLVVDLGQRIGSREWWRGLATCTVLCGLAISFAPGFAPLQAPVAPALGERQQQEMKAEAIAPLAYGADTGRPVAPTNLVEKLADTPERPQIQVTATLGTGDGFARVLQRAGVGADEAKSIAATIAGRTDLSEIKAGTKLDLTLGRRPNKDVARPLDHLAFRARLDLALAMDRVGTSLKLTPRPIAVDDTPLRIQGQVGGSMLSSARAAGAPASAIQTWLRAMGQHVSIQGIHSNDKFDIIVEHRRAADGMSETGGLLFAGLQQGKKELRLLKWTLGGKEQFFDAAGVGETRGNMRMPVQGHQTSSFGLRFHPVLGYSRMHKGIDYGAPMGSPIIAATDGTVNFAGWHGGHGNYVQLKQSASFGTGYAHMSRIAVRAGQHVRAGQILGYVGSTGLSTGPHLHFEVFVNNVAVNPAGVKFLQAAQLAGAELNRFKATLAHLMGLRSRG
ncbi:MAG: M23 family metallopeptidase [Sphingomonadales bacterium]|nr:M23 family metallopeptidase [Sphingomonadales bacterium]